MSSSLSQQSYFEIVSDIPRTDLSDAMHALGATLGTATSELGLIGYGDDRPLGVHSETLYNRHMCRYFMLGCIEAAEEGGESTIYDGVQATKIVMEEAPELAQAILTCRTGATSDSEASGHIVRSLIPDEQTLCFRQEFDIDSVTQLPNGWDRHGFYLFMDTVLDRSLLFSGVLEPGSIILVDNYRTLHGRLAYSGIRKMIRVRVDE